MSRVKRRCKVRDCKSFTQSLGRRDGEQYFSTVCRSHRHKPKGRVIRDAIKTQK